MHSITNLVENYGYIVLFPLIALEGLGLPLPGETALVAASAFAATGHLSIYGVLFTAAAAAIVGDNGGYWIGRKGGLALVQRYSRTLHINESRIAQVRDFFERYGAKAVFLGRFIALLRSWTAVLAGVGLMRYRTFFFYNALGGAVWATMFGTLGYLFGRNLPALEHYMGQASLAVALLVSLLVGIVIALRWFGANETTLAEQIAQTRERLRHSELLWHMRSQHPRLWAFVMARLSPDEYWGLHFTVGLAVSVAALWLFAGVTEDVIHHDPLTLFDVTILEWLHRHRTPLGIQVSQAVSWFGSLAFISVLGVAVVLVFAYQRQWAQLRTWAVALAGAGLLDQLLKVTIRRPRPVYASAFFHDGSFSFPSGHALASLVTYGMLAYFLARSRGIKHPMQIVLSATTGFLVIAIGFSRLYLGVHYFSDVIGGYAAGFVWLASCITGLELERTRQRIIGSGRLPR